MTETKAERARLEEDEASDALPERSQAGSSVSVTPRTLATEHRPRVCRRVCALLVLLAALLIVLAMSICALIWLLHHQKELAFAVSTLSTATGTASVL